MGTPDILIPFPFGSIELGEVAPDPALFDSILKGEGELADFEFGYCVTTEENIEQRRYLLIFQRKPYAAGTFTGPQDIQSTTLREFFVYLAQHPKVRLYFLKPDPS